MLRHDIWENFKTEIVQRSSFNGDKIIILHYHGIKPESS